MKLKKFKLKKRKDYFSMKISFIVASLLLMCIGHAFITSRININGTLGVTKGSWNIYFDNTIVSEGSVNKSNPVINTAGDKASASFSASFSAPDDYYEFEVDIVNDGTHDAMIKDIKIEGIPSNLEKYIYYNISYIDHSLVSINHMLAANSRERIKVKIKFDGNENIADLLDANNIIVDLNFNLSLIITFGQANGDVINKNAIQRLGLSKDAQPDSDINFVKYSSDTNGNGLYIHTDSNGEIYNASNPIYYYRGDINNNNVVFANYCWKIVRTTETGGTKLIYNGSAIKELQTVPLEKNEYVNITDDINFPWNYDYTTKKWNSTNKGDIAKSTTSTLKFSISNSGHYILHYLASSESPKYDYGKFYKDTTSTQIGSAYGGNNVSGTLDLGTINSSTVIIATYTKDGSGNSYNDEIVFWLEKEVGSINRCTYTTGTATQLSSNSAFNPSGNVKYLGYMYDISQNSTAKVVLDKWYEDNILNKYDDYLEDTIWCNDKSESTLSGNNTYYGFGTRSILNKERPSLICTSIDDSYTTITGNNEKGNKLLKYPIGLLTGDEAQLAGYAWYANNSSTYNKTNYLYNGQNYWLMSPSYYYSTYPYGTFISSSGAIYSGTTNSSYGIRPVVSIKSDKKFTLQSNFEEAGTPANPYIVVEK